MASLTPLFVRLWRWFQSQGVTVQFFGPYTGTFENSATDGVTPVPPQPPGLYGSTQTSSGISVNGKYAVDVDQAFLSNNAHFAN